MTQFGVSMSAEGEIGNVDIRQSTVEPDTEPDTEAQDGEPEPSARENVDR
jgi:hypothetical protein